MASGSKATGEGGREPGSLALMARAAALTVLVAAGWVFMEWLFFATKPSFMSLYPPLVSAGVLAGSVTVAALSLSLIAAPFILAGALLQRLTPARRRAFLIQSWPAVVVLAATGVMAVDNFTLTLFGFGIRNASGWTLWLYRAVTLVAVALAARWLYAAWFRTGSLPRWALGIVSLALVGGLALTMLTTGGGADAPADLPLTDARRPNILVVSGDGIAADHMSLYGYERPTTPFLDSIREQLLLADQHFPNAADTGGSIISLLTGKLPTTTRVVYPPDVLQGEDAWQHLPGVLRSLGYYNVDISLRHYADPYDLNLRNGFDESTLRRIEATGGILLSALRRVPALNPVSMLLERMGERAQERYAHVWKGQPMSDPMSEVNEPDRQWLQDERRMQELQRIIDTAPRPFFVHMHLMVSHGPRFRPRVRQWSDEADYQNIWSADGYDDAVADFDRYLSEIHAALEAAGMLEETILVVTSDHGKRHAVLERVPLAFRLPGRHRTGRIGGVTQRIDIAPTLVDELGLEPLPWMEGTSLLQDPGSWDQTRPVFATRVKAEKTAEDIWYSAVDLGPPWYSLGYLYLVRCAQGFELRLRDMRLRESDVTGGTECADALSGEAARELLLAHLHDRGYRW